MSIDFSSETPIAFSEAGDHIPGHPHISTAHRWRLHGVRGVKLETFLCGGRRFTTKEAIARFIAHLNGTDPAPSVRQAAERQQRLAKARAELRARGV